MILLFTGNGKGKTTAAFGQAIRGLGQKKSVFIVQFIKSLQKTGEYLFFEEIKKFFPIEIRTLGRGFVGILGDKLDFKVHQKAAQKALKTARQAIKSRKWEIIILDEINVAIYLKLLKVSEVLEILKNIPAEKIVILTGRYAPKSFYKLADLVTEMKEIKHPFKKGEIAKRGLEY